MARAVLFCNGEIRDIGYHKALIRDDDYIIAVDGGGRYCVKMNLLPSVAIGDFDSLPEDIKKYFTEKNVETVDFPADKDYIDMVLGIEEARKRGFEDILILGAFGGKRVDMFMGNLLALAGYDECIVMKNEENEVRFLQGGKKLDFYGRIGHYVSILPLSDTVAAAESTGLKYPLEGLVFHRGETRSISNEFVKETASVSLKEGTALVVIQTR